MGGVLLGFKKGEYTHPCRRRKEISRSFCLDGIPGVEKPMDYEKKGDKK